MLGFLHWSVSNVFFLCRVQDCMTVKTKNNEVTVYYAGVCAIITWRGGVGKLEGGIGENDNKREGDWMKNLIHLIL